MNQPLKILITNDDGIYADGIIRLARTALDFGEVWVVAPDSQRSAFSHRITLRQSFEAWEVEFPVPGLHAYACTGTPGDCVRIGVMNIVPGRPDVLLSGINYGFNAASDLQYSATVGAAFESSFQRVPAIAFSEDMSENHVITDRYLPEILAELLEKPQGLNKIWNVNFPCCSPEEFKGILRDRTVSDGMFFDDSYTETPLDNGRISYHVLAKRSYEAEEGTDLRALLDNYISIGIVHNLQ